MTDNEVIKALECCCVSECDECPYDEQTACVEMMKEGTLALINRKDVVIAELQHKNAELKIELKAMRGVANSYKAEVGRYEQLIPNKYCVCTRVGNGLIYSESSEDYDKIIGEISSEAIKEFAERFKDKYKKPFFYLGSYEQFMQEVDNLVKEMTEEGVIPNDKR